MFDFSNPLVKRALIKSGILILFALIVAISLGITLSKLNNLKEINEMLESKKPSLPSRLLDRNGNLITEFYADEKRDIVTLDDVPEFLVQALILWEDESFYHHKGFNLFAIFRAAVNNILGKPVSGASTLTQQLSRTLFLSRQRSFKRKIRELWISIQLEKKYTKNEILSLYLNHVPLGYGTNGVQAASKFYFDKNVQDLTYAEAASLITIISNPTAYSFLKFPTRHKTKQKRVLEKLVKNGIITEAEAEQSFNEFWLKWQSSSHTTRGAFFNREDKAPFFSDWVLNKLKTELPNVDVFRDGLVIHSTLDLKWNNVINKMMSDKLELQQKIFEREQLKNYKIIQSYFIDTLQLMGDTFSLTNLNIGANRNQKRGMTEYSKDINPALNLLSQSFGLNLLSTVTQVSFDKIEKSKQLLSKVHGAFLVLDNKTGQILCMFGGKDFDPNNRFNYAMQSRRQPGSAFKPFVYSAAFDTGRFNPATIIYDQPYVFTFDSDDPDDWYRPYNYGARYYGKLTVRQALRRSLNIPACKVFYAIGYSNNYSVPLNRAALLLGINSQSEIDRRFSREVSTVLGTGSVSPLEMARAFSVFANLGQKRIPNTILYVEDRNGKIIYNPQKELDRYYKENKKKLQIISASNSFLITSILHDVVTKPDGTLAGTKRRLKNSGKEFDDNVDFAAKTGTTQNWSDAWTIGFSPLVTAVGWVGFDEYGLSLGYEQPGARVVGPIWLEFMREYHKGKGPLKFEKPPGVVTVNVCRESGKLPSPYCSESTIGPEYFIQGKVPTTECTYCKANSERENNNIEEFMKTYDTNFSDKKVNIDNSYSGVDLSIVNEYGSEENNNSKLLDMSDTSDISLFDITDDESTSNITNSKQIDSNSTISTTIVTTTTVNTNQVPDSTIDLSNKPKDNANKESDISSYKVNTNEIKLDEYKISEEEKNKKDQSSD